MNRRSFFTGLIATAPALFLPKIVKASWKDTMRYGATNVRCTINPDYTVPMPYDERALHGEWWFHSDVQISACEMIETVEFEHKGNTIRYQNFNGVFKRV